MEWDLGFLKNFERLKEFKR